MTELFIALAAGLISFLSPCVLPLIPGYISFISGQSLNELLQKKKINLLPLILFSLGFSTVFIIFGATASVLGKFLLQNSQQLRIFAGIIIIKPATILNVCEFCKRICPKKEAAAPKIIKTKENPKENNISGVKFIFFFTSNSFNEAPEIKEI